MIEMLTTRNIPNVGQYLEGKKYAADALGLQLIAQGFAIEAQPKKSAAKAATVKDEGTDK